MSEETKAPSWSWAAMPRFGRKEVTESKKWHPPHLLGSLMVWLDDRASRHTDWVDDGCKYVRISFDSRDGSFCVTSDHGDILLHRGV